jgi:hypothetical protein
MRGRVCILYMLLALASAVFLGSESLGSRDHILLSQIWYFLSTLLKVKVTLRLTVSQSVSLGVEPHLGLMTRYLVPFDSYGLFLWGALSDERTGSRLFSTELLFITTLQRPRRKHSPSLVLKSCLLCRCITTDVPLLLLAYSLPRECVYRVVALQWTYILILLFPLSSVISHYFIFKPPSGASINVTLNPLQVTRNGDYIFVHVTQNSCISCNEFAWMLMKVPLLRIVPTLTTESDNKRHGRRNLNINIALFRNFPSL